MVKMVWLEGQCEFCSLGIADSGAKIAKVNIKVFSDTKWFGDSFFPFFTLLQISTLLTKLDETGPVFHLRFFFQNHKVNEQRVRGTLRFAFFHNFSCTNSMILPHFLKV